VEETRTGLIMCDQMTNLDRTNFCWYAPEGKLTHQTEKCLHFNGKWRQVCLACDRIEIDGNWFKVTEIDALVPQ